MSCAAEILGWTNSIMAGIWISFFVTNSAPLPRRYTFLIAVLFLLTSLLLFELSKYA